MVDYPQFEENRILSNEGNALVLRIALKRATDNQYTVIHTEFHDPDSDPEMLVADIGTQWEDLQLDTEKIEDCIFYPTLLDAVDASKLAMIDFSKWMKNAQD